MGTIYGCQNANQKECCKCTNWKNRKMATAFDWKDLVSIVTPRTVITEEMMAMIIATTVVIR